jgi:hypothetical protein
MWGFSQSLKLCAFLLFTLAQVEDIQLLWQAKTTSFDTMCGLDDQLLVGAGVPITIAYLQQVQDPWSEQARAYIEEGYQFDNDALTRYRNETNKFFHKILSMW